MSSIRILPDILANRIAAGEVVERPASVVKELVENSLDAGAKRITVQTRQGGRRLIQISDDGCGMDREDAMLCIEPHATSKIREPGDIDRIATLGFRGEALPSIAAVSRFLLQTRTAEQISGTEVLIESGVLRDVRDCGCPPGTNIKVEHLFANVPARRKFLQSRTTEDGHIQEAVLLHALAHSDVTFELTMNDRQVLHARQSGNVGTRLAMLLGKDVLAAMAAVDYHEDGIRVSGFVARPGLTRSSRREQRVFVNGRPATANTVYFGIRDAYHTMVMKGRYPPVVLYIEIDPERVDVNVHPAKREVRFRESRLVGRVVTAAVGRALRELAGELAVPAQPSFGAGPSAGPSAPPPPLALGAILDQPNLLATPLGAPLPVPGPAAAPGHAADTPAATSAGAAAGGPAGTGAGTSPSAATRDELRTLQILGTIADLYLIAEGAEGLVLIDQHAAHERILFEQLLRIASGRAGARQQLLLPVTIDLTPTDAALLQQHLDDLKRLGFGLEHFGGNTFLVTAVPTSFPEENVSGLLQDMLDDLRQGVDAGNISDDVRLAQAACKHAVKANDALDEREIRRLLADLAGTEMPYTCPHGRPVMINLSFKELEKRFGRQT